MQQHSNNIYIELFRQVEGAFVKALELTIGRTGAFGKDNDGVTIFYNVHKLLAQEVKRYFCLSRKEKKN
jgi:hypothetical protein